MNTYYTVVWQGGENQFRYFGSQSEALTYLHQLILTRRVSGKSRIGLGEKRSKSIDFYGTPNEFNHYFDHLHKGETELKAAEPFTGPYKKSASLGNFFRGITAML